jgi:CSLREA domain-containing protein
MRRLLTALLLVAASVSYAGAQSGFTFVVNSTGDGADNNPGNGVCNASGGCTLRAAIQEANAHAGPDTIQFAIGSGQQTINVGSALPAITSPVTIDAWTQPGFAGTPLIVLNGGSGNGFTLNSGSSTVRGFVITSFSGTGVQINGAGGNVVEGNYIGPDATGAAGGNNQGVTINGSPDNRIGGREKVQRNVISGNTAKGNTGGITIDNNATGNIIQGNFIGSDVTGMIPMGNQGRGVAIHSGSNNFVGGALPGAGNLIMGNRATGVRVISGTGNLIMNNWIGLRSDGTHEFGVTSNARGIQLRSDGNSAVGNYVVGHLYDGILMAEGSASNNLVQQNIVYGNGMHGIDAVLGTGNKFLYNQVFGNGYLSIAISNNDFSQVTLNDAGDTDSGTNDLQNFPVVTSASTAGAVAGTLNSRPNQTYLVQFFANPGCNASGHGDATYYIGQTNVTTNASGNGSFAVALGFGLPNGWTVTSTATNPGNSTSELSACTIVK